VAAGLFAAVALACALPAWAGDTVRLNQVEQVSAQRLVDDGQGADTVPVWHRGFGYGGFGYRGFGYGGYRGFGYGGYRGFGYGLGYRGLGYGLGYRGFGYGLGYGRFGYGLGGLGLGYRGFGYGLGGYGLGGYGLGGYGLGYGLGGYGLGGYGLGGYGLGYWGCSSTTASTLSLGISGPVVSGPLPAEPVAPAPLETPAAPGEETYPYDGGPVITSPPPVINPEQTGRPAASAPAKELAVSAPKKAKLSYPAYGEKPQRRNALSGSTLLTSGR
jgi:hypothetical protein